jgi:hypothetical protein
MFTPVRTEPVQKEMAMPVATTLRGETYRKFEKLRQESNLKPAELLRQMVEHCLAERVKL